MLLIDKYAYTNRLRKVNPMVKFFYSIGLILTTLIFENIYLSIFVILINSFLIVNIAKIKFKNYINILKIPMFFLILSIISICISITFLKSSDYIYQINVFNFYILITKESLITGINLLFKSLGSITCMFFLILTTPINDLIKVFIKLKISESFIELFVLIYRFIFIFLEESNKIYNAQKLRNGYDSISNSYKSLGILISMLLIRVMKKYEEMKVALKVKGYSGKFY